ncbi:pyridoxamine 5'-phosphate oxidase family protein [Microbacterium sp. NEAU-LLC]|uniref:Pyridoxamine 5'-phosphate oxidase family protein n=1 Tax=Microbacterium helvum TaxID=2773713 RepID=A0ABR8NN61_9MICO|nr:pyridoxamine 5'-phosphate oxidase family protein [Microbacterium helvum]MBD3941227.1 pyridoxamine 5'-phosphate oxidase family protein [Microbacterium helvum]
MNDSSRAARTPGVERLASSECWEYLQRAEFGRLAVIHADGAPDIFPVNHLAHEGALYIRTARDAKLVHIAAHPLVAYEVDGMTDDQVWSVVARGRAERVMRDDEIRDSGVRGLASWSPTAKFFAMKVTVNAVTGRRFPRDAHTERLIPFEQEAVAPAEQPSPRASRGDRPEPIPHFGPATGALPTTPPVEPPG